MQLSLKTLFGLVGGAALCVFVATKSHPYFAIPMAGLVLWAMISAYRPKLADKIELFAALVVAAILLLALITYLSYSL